MTRLLGVAVVVPAHDEQDTVLACLAAVAAATGRLREVRPDLAVTTCVALDACRDSTAALVATRPDVLSVVLEERRVGAARAVGTAAALAALGGPPERVWTAHTDADSVVPTDWLAAMVVAAEDGADAVLGTVLPDDALAPGVREAWSVLHPPGEGHPHVHGANFGVRASALTGVGGWRALVTGEDVDLALRLQAHPELRVLSTAVAPVVTSSREVGRAPEGFAEYLQELTVA